MSTHVYRSCSEDTDTQVCKSCLMGRDTCGQQLPPTWAHVCARTVLCAWVHMCKSCSWAQTTHGQEMPGGPRHTRV